MHPTISPKLKHSSSRRHRRHSRPRCQAAADSCCCDEIGTSLDSLSLESNCKRQRADNLYLSAATIRLTGKSLHFSAVMLPKPAPDQPKVKLCKVYCGLLPSVKTSKRQLRNPLQLTHHQHSPR
ncbi:hypothetical protein BASA82_000247 [Batrachochytrium salamandrivorans]|nr:hypothetical protein BASA82_000247 [Batrachochytrium salamandrivorans]